MTDIDPHEDEARRLLGLAADTRLPSAVDVDLAVVDGSRRVRRRQLIASAFAVVSLAAVGLGAVGVSNLGRPNPAPPLASAQRSALPPTLAAGPLVAPANLGDLSPQRVAGAPTPNGLLVATRGRDGRINVRVGPGEWTALAGPVTSSPSATAAPDGRIFLAARGKAGDVLLRTMTGGKWDEWKSLGGEPTTSAPSITATGDKLVLAVRTANDFVRYAVVAAAAPTSPDWRTLGNRITSAAPITSPVPDARGCVDVTARGADDRRIWVNQICPDGTPGLWKQRSTALIASGAAQVGQLVWFRGSNGKLFLFTGSGEPRQIGVPPDLEIARIAGTPTAVVTGGGTLVVLVRAPTSSEVWVYAARQSDPTGGQWSPYGGYAS